MPNSVMSLPNRGDPTRGENKKKTTGGIDASMITRMKREQAIVSELRTEDRRYGLSTPISGVAASSTDLVFTIPTLPANPYVVGENITISGNTGSITTNTTGSSVVNTARTATIASIVTTTDQVTLTAAFASPVVISLGTVMTSNAVGGIAAGSYIVTSVTSQTVFTLSNYNMTDSSVTTWTPSSASGGATLTINIVTHTLVSGTTAPVFLAGDSVVVAGFAANTGYNGTFNVLANTGTTIQYQALGTSGSTVNGTGVTITPVSSRYNGTFKVNEVTPSSVTVTATIYGLFTAPSRTTGTISGFRPIGQVFLPLVDKPMTRGFTDGPVMPFFRRSASLGFFRSL